jgi:hypothetical protein
VGNAHFAIIHLNSLNLPKNAELMDVYKLLLLDVKNADSLIH